MDRALLCGQQHRTDLHATGTEGHGCLKLTVICDPAGRDDRNLDGRADVRDELAHRVRCPEMAASLLALDDDGRRTKTF